MATFKLKVINNIICSELSGELDAALVNQWVEKLEELESGLGNITRRFYDVRKVSAVNVDFDNLYSFAQRRIKMYQDGDEILTAFWVSTPLNYGMARMFQSLTESTPLKVEVHYTLKEITDFLNIDILLLENVTY